MQEEEIYIKTKEAYEKGEFYELLKGKGDYFYSNWEMRGKHDDWTILEKGIFPLYSKTKDEGIVNQTEKAIKKLLNGCQRDIWRAVYIMFGIEDPGLILKKEKFHLNPDLIEYAKEVVLKNKEALMNNHRGEGNGFTYGLWGDIIRYYQIYLEDIEEAKNGK